MKSQISATTLVLGFLVFANCVFAVPTHPNEIGLYMTPDGYGATGTSVLGEIVEVYLVLTKPTDSESGLPLNSIGTFECQLNFSSFPTDGLLKISPDIFPSEAINVGDSTNLNDGTLEFIVGFIQGNPVIDEAVVLVTIRFLLLTTSEIEVTLGPTSTSSIPGQMCFDLIHSQKNIMYPVSGSPNDPVFYFNGMAVSVENETFGSIKAMYR